MAQTIDDLFELAAATPEHIEHALKASASLDGLPSKEKIEQVVIVGMGASGVAGDALIATAAPFMPVPVTVVKSYELPAFVSEGSLVFAVSQSGNTEETVEAATDAAVQGAKVVVISSGGQLTELAGSWGSPIVRLSKSLTSGRLAVGSLVIPPIAILEEIGLFPGARQWIDLAIDQLKVRRDELSKSGNTAATLAEKLAGKISVIQGGGAVGAAAAQRWKGQINANAKMPAFWSAQPEVCHNEVMGWAGAPQGLRDDSALISLRHDDEHPQVTRRFDFVHEYLKPTFSVIEEVRAEGDGDIAQLFDLFMIGDFVSLHMAKNAGVDPTVDPFVDKLKTELSDN